MNEYKISKESIDAAIAKMHVEGYESPIDVLINHETDAFAQFIEGAVMKSVIQADVHVDKDELIRALDFDRHQYELGFRKGLRSAIRFGRWQRRLVNRYGYAEEDFVCSACEKEFDCVFVRALVDQDEFSFCPNCGAQMLENEEAEK